MVLESKVVRMPEIPALSLGSGALHWRTVPGSLRDLHAQDGPEGVVGAEPDDGVVYSFAARVMVEPAERAEAPILLLVRRASRIQHAVCIAVERVAGAPE